MSEEVIFNPYIKFGKWMDNLEREFTEYAHDIILEWGWDPDELTEEQVDAIRVYIDTKEEEGWDFLMMGFRNVCNWAEDNFNE
jgi:hypothetical protein